MSKGANYSEHLQGDYPFDPESLKLDSLKYLLLERWIIESIAEVPSARLPLKTAYLFYLHYCNSEGIPCVSIQAFNRTVTDVMPQRWPTARRRRTARGTLYDNLTLRGWAPYLDIPSKRSGESSDCSDLSFA